jgi:hypothetical protein
MNNLLDEIPAPANGEIFTEVLLAIGRAYRADRLDGAVHTGG